MHKNIAPETKPCEIICTSAPSIASASNRKKPRVTKPICAIDEYATSFLISRCASATSDRTITKGASRRLASGTIGSEKRRKPYAPSLSMIAASTTEPPVGASTCASGSQVCSGHIGTLTAKAIKKAPNNSNCGGIGSGSRCQSASANEPDCVYRYSSANSISSEPSSV